MHGSSVVLTALFTSVLTATGTTYLIERYDVLRPPREILAPGLVGLSEADARANAEALGLSLLIEGREPSVETKPGTVVRQTIAQGQPLQEHASIGVIFADALPVVPKVVGLSLDEARRALKASGYAAEVAEAVPDATLAAGLVVAQTPAADSGLVSGATVTLQPSSGSAAVVAPTLTGLSLKGAREKLAELGLEAKVRWISRAETLTYIVLSQSPAPGKAVEPGSQVEVVINR
jgi:serine/threonine-protein kinase